MRYKINKKDFESVFINRKLTSHERYLQTFWLCKDEGGNYWVEQKVKIPVIIIISICALIALPFLFIGVTLISGIGEAKDTITDICWKDWKINIVRTDRCNTLHQQNRDIIQLTLDRCN